MPTASGARLGFGSFRFTKMHGAGNDFVLLDLRDDAPLAKRLSEDAARVCRALADRHTGVGCDQILTIESPRAAEALASYRVWNSDGSPSQQCGNGARCVAAWLVRDGSAQAHRFTLESPAGTHAVEHVGDDTFEIAMGPPQFAPQAIPIRGFVHAQDEYAIESGGVPLRFGAVSMGNPHAVIEVLDVDATAVDVIGTRMQGDATFPESVNVGFAEVVSRGHIRLRVHERGVGETLACGSGACAAVAVLTRRGRVGGAQGVLVSLPGGELRIHYDPESGGITMTGPATFVFDGEWLQ
ncbi:MAG: diaminopimelate epimerase [Luteimonas sp.]